MAIRFEDKTEGGKPVRKPPADTNEADRPSATELPLSHPKAEPKGKTKRKGR